MELRRPRRVGPRAGRLHRSPRTNFAHRFCKHVTQRSPDRSLRHLMNSLEIFASKTLHTQMNKTRLISLLTAALALALSLAQAQPTLIAIGSLTGSRAGADTDLSGLTYLLENQAPANLLGGLGSAITYDVGKKFLLLPDRGPNATTFDPLIDNTVST